MPYRAYSGRYYRKSDFPLPTAASRPQAAASHPVAERQRLSSSFHVEKSEKKSSNGNWHIKKHIPSEREALRETLAQEYCRLLIPDQPKTRWHIKEGWWSREYCISSQDVVSAAEEAKTFSSSSRAEVFRGESFAEICVQKENETLEQMRLRVKRVTSALTGFGATSFAALMTQEIDFKHDHLLVVGNKLIKIDGDYTLGRFVGDSGTAEARDIKSVAEYDAAANIATFDIYTPNGASIGVGIRDRPITKDTHNITVAILKELPFTPGRYKVKNWIKPSLGPEETARAQQEVFQTLLKALIIPDDVLQKFVFSYADQDLTSAQQFFEILLGRKQQAAAAAKDWPEFQHYLKSSEAKRDALEYINYLANFKTTADHILVDETRIRLLQQEFTEKSADIALKSISTLNIKKITSKDITLYSQRHFNFCFRLLRHPIFSSFIAINLLLWTAFFPPLVAAIGLWSWGAAVGMSLGGTALLHSLPTRFADTIRYSEAGRWLALVASGLAVGGFVTFAVLNPFTLPLVTLLGIGAGLIYLLVGPTITGWFNHLVTSLTCLPPCCGSASVETEDSGSVSGASPVRRSHPSTPPSSPYRSFKGGSDTSTDLRHPLPPGSARRGSALSINSTSPDGRIAMSSSTERDERSLDSLAVLPVTPIVGWAYVPAVVPV